MSENDALRDQNEKNSHARKGNRPGARPGNVIQETHNLNMKTR